ncbi:MAG: hypothetical protein WKG00_04150 [Polyangiaceae bacterium]
MRMRGFLPSVLGFTVVLASVLGACSDDDDGASTGGTGPAGPGSGGAAASGGAGGSGGQHGGAGGDTGGGTAGQGGDGGAGPGGAGGTAGSGGAGGAGVGGGAGEGEVCAGSVIQTCATGLVCCYPCGIPDCDSLCSVPCSPDEPGCRGGCPLVP